MAINCDVFATQVGDTCFMLFNTDPSEEQRDEVGKKLNSIQ